MLLSGERTLMCLIKLRSHALKRFLFKMSQIKIELCDNELCPKKETKQKYHYNSVNKVIKYLLTGMRYKDTEYA